MTSRTGKHNYNTYIAQYVIKQRQSVNELGQVVEFNLRNIFLHKSCRKWGSEITSRLLFDIFKKALHKVKPIGQHLSFNIDNINIGNFGRPWLGHTIQINFVTFKTIYPKICSIWIFYKRACD